MNIELQVCTKEQGKRLQELGVKVEPVFYHIPWKTVDFDGVFIAQECDKGFFHCLDGEVETLCASHFYPAYTVAELGELLPSGYDTMRCVGDSKGDIWRGYDTSGEDVIPDGFWDTEAAARAAMLIHLLENKLITTNTTNNELDSSKT